VNIEDATAHHVPVVYTPGAMSRAVAEHTLALLFAAYKRINIWKEALAAGNWLLKYQASNLDLEVSAVGIVGYGRIGKEVRHLLRCTDAKVMANDPYINHSEFASHQVEFLGFHELLERSDIVTLHVPLSAETRGMINRSNIDRFKEGAVLINTARGAVIEDLDLLYESLERGLLSAVCLDVFPQEPPDTSHPLFQHPRAFLTPHVAAQTPIANHRIFQTMATQVCAILRGKEPNPHTVVNPEVLQHYASPTG
jgi:phosphoglycerate dehydrogenase-like enzyme